MASPQFDPAGGVFLQHRSFRFLGRPCRALDVGRKEVRFPLSRAVACAALSDGSAMAARLPGGSDCRAKGGRLPRPPRHQPDSPQRACQRGPRRTPRRFNAVSRRQPTTVLRGFSASWPDRRGVIVWPEPNGGVGVPPPGRNLRWWGRNRDTRHRGKPLRGAAGIVTPNANGVAARGARV